MLTLIGNLPGGADARFGSGQRGGLHVARDVLPARQAAGGRAWTSSPPWARCSATRSGCWRCAAAGRWAGGPPTGGCAATCRPAGRCGGSRSSLAAALSKSGQADTAGSHHATDDPDEADFLLTDTGLAQRILTHPGVLLFLGLTVIALVAERSLLGSGPLGGGALIPAWGGASGLWHEYLQGFHPVGIGSGSSAPPYLAVIAALATVLGGKPWLAVDVILLGCVPLAGISAFLAVRRVTRSTPVRVWAAAVVCAAARRHGRDRRRAGSAPPWSSC